MEIFPYRTERQTLICTWLSRPKRKLGDPNANLSLYVDDTSMQAVGETDLDVQSDLIPALSAFNAAVTKHKLRLSPKAVISASSMRLAKTLQSQLKRCGMSFTVSRLARDLGVTYNSGLRRPSTLLVRRLGKLNVESLKYRV